MINLANVKIGQRLAVGFSLVLALTVVTAGAGIWRLNDVVATTKMTMDVPLSKERMISDWYALIASSIRRTTAIVKSSDPSLAEYFKPDMAETIKQGDVRIAKLVPLITEAREKAAYQHLMENREAYNKARDRAIKAKSDGNAEEAARIFESEFVPAARGFQDAMQALLALQRQAIDDQVKTVGDVGDTSTRIMEVLALAAVLLGAVCSWFITRSIVSPIREAVAVSETVASGDLTRTIDVVGDTETGALLRALRHMNDSLVGIVGQVRSGTETITSAAREISIGNGDLAARTEQQAGALKETADSMGELTTTVRQNAENARQANQLAIAASEVASQGGAVVGQVVSTMSAIHASAGKIVDIISVIDGIAFQTNILALNAAVEAARAGEQGRGFAVVAGEVRTLAQRSAAAAKEIKGLITDSVANVDAGSKLVDQAGATMEQVVSSIRRVTDIVAEITCASQEQSGDIEQVSQAIHQMDHVTQQNAVLVQQAAAAAASMQEQAARLAELVSVFKLNGQRAAGRLALSGR